MRGIRLLVGLLFALSVGLVGCDAEPPEPTVDPGIIAALAPACTGPGHVIAGAGSMATLGNPINHIVLLNTSGQPFAMTDGLPADWRPVSLADTELVACTPEEPIRTLLEVCPYNGSDITRYEVTRQFGIVEPSSGRIVASFDITADPRACHATEDASLTELEGTIQQEMVTAHLIGLVEHGRFIDPDAAGPTAEPGQTLKPGPTGKPGQTSKPGQTAKPTPTLEATELRQALADGQISVTGTGDGLQHLDLELTSQVDFDLDVTILVGTLLEPGARSTQRMVVVNEQVISLGPQASESASLDVACVEMHQDQPTGDDRFHVLDEQPPADLLALLATPEFADASGRVEQFAVWTITNNPKRHGYQALGTTYSVFGTQPSDEEMAEIFHLFDMADIDMGKYRALRDL